MSTLAVQVVAVGSGAEGTSPTVAVCMNRRPQWGASDVPLHQLLFGCGEASARCLADARVKATLLSHACLTSGLADNLAGLPSLQFALAERGAGALTVVAPHHSGAVIAGVPTYVRRRYPVVTVVHPDAATVTADAGGGVAPLRPPSSPLPWMADCRAANASDGWRGVYGWGGGDCGVRVVAVPITASVARRLPVAVGAAGPASTRATPALARGGGGGGGGEIDLDSDPAGVQAADEALTWLCYLLVVSGPLADGPVAPVVSVPPPHEAEQPPTAAKRRRLASSSSTDSSDCGSSSSTGSTTHGDKSSTGGGTSPAPLAARLKRLVVAVIDCPLAGGAAVDATAHALAAQLASVLEERDSQLVCVHLTRAAVVAGDEAARCEPFAVPFPASPPSPSGRVGEGAQAAISPYTAALVTSAPWCHARHLFIACAPPAAYAASSRPVYEGAPGSSHFPALREAMAARAAADPTRFAPPLPDALYRPCYVPPLGGTSTGVVPHPAAGHHVPAAQALPPLHSQSLCPWMDAPTPPRREGSGATCEGATAAPSATERGGIAADSDTASCGAAGDGGSCVASAPAVGGASAALSTTSHADRDVAPPGGDEGSIGAAAPLTRDAHSSPAADTSTSHVPSSPRAAHMPVTTPHTTPTERPPPLLARLLRATTPHTVFLGTGAAAPSARRGCSGLLLWTPAPTTAGGSWTLVDCGEGVSSRLAVALPGWEDALVPRAGLGVPATVTVWISHMHADHHCGLLPLLAAVVLRGPARVHIVGPPALGALLPAYLRLIALEAAACRALPTAAVTAWLALAVTFAALPAHHVGHPLPAAFPVAHSCRDAWGCVLRWLAPPPASTLPWRGAVLVYSGDTRPCDAVPAAAAAAVTATVAQWLHAAGSGGHTAPPAGLRVCVTLVHEATFDDAEGHGNGEGVRQAAEKAHSTRGQAVEVWRRVQAAVATVAGVAVSHRCVLTHISQRYNEAAEGEADDGGGGGGGGDLPKGVCVAEDGMVGQGWWE
jgi:ribonuclease BN (tRNA processing enzyme)